MSIRVSDLLWKSIFPHSGSALLVMHALADYSDDAGCSYPAVATLADKVRLSRSQTQRVLRKLEREGWVTIVGNRQGGFHPVASCHYRINLSALRSKPPKNKRRCARLEPECAATGRMDATRTFTDPPHNPQEPEACSPGGLPEQLDATHGSQRSAPLAAELRARAVLPPAHKDSFYNEGVRDDGRF